MTKLTLVIVNHNNSQWLFDCFDSINKQSLADFDLLFVDDASTDSSTFLFNQYPWRHGIRAQSLQLTENVGVSKARISGMSLVKTDYVTSLDSDDFLISPEKLERELALALQAPSSIAFSRVVLVDAAGIALQIQPKRPVREGNLQLEILQRSIMIPRDFVMPLKLYDQAGGYDPELNLYEDWDLKIRLAKQGIFRYTGLDGIAYRKHNQGLSSVATSQHRQAQSRVITKNLPLYAKLLTLEDLLTVLAGLNLTAQ